MLSRLSLYYFMQKETERFRIMRPFRALNYLRDAGVRILKWAAFGTSTDIPRTRLDGLFLVAYGR